MNSSDFVAKWNQPLLSDQEALDAAAFVNDDAIHIRPTVKNYDYPFPEEKAIDYDIPPFADSFPTLQHKNGPFQPIITAWKNKGLKPSY